MDASKKKSFSKVRSGSKRKKIPKPLRLPKSSETGPFVITDNPKTPKPTHQRTTSELMQSLSIDPTLISPDCLPQNLPRFDFSGNTANLRGPLLPSPQLIPVQRKAGEVTGSSTKDSKMAPGMERVQAASLRLQRALGLRNEEPLSPMHRPDASEVSNMASTNPTLRHLLADLGPPRRGNSSRLSRTEPPTAMTARQLENLATFERGLAERAGPTIGQHETSLRETLLWHGRQPYGQQTRVEIASISFHDLTPSSRSGTVSNELVAEFSADEGGKSKIVAYEVNVQDPPSSDRNEAGPPATQRWMYFLISTPILNVHSSYYSLFEPEPLPPNLARPIPTSWVVFAAPMSSIEAHHGQSDQIPNSAGTIYEPVGDVKRLDFDYSHDGVPIFEFMNKGQVLGEIGKWIEGEVQGDFLCTARDLMGWTERINGGSDIAIAPRQEVARDASSDSDATEIEMDIDEDIPYPRRPKRIVIRSPGPDVVMGGQDMNQGQSFGSTRGAGAGNGETDIKKSPWWHHAKISFLQDRIRWERIREAMSRGCCRVTVHMANSAAPKPEQRSVFGAQPEPAAPGLGLHPRFGPRLGQSVEISARTQYYVGADGYDHIRPGTAGPAVADYHGFAHMRHLGLARSPAFQSPPLTSRRDRFAALIDHGLVVEPLLAPSRGLAAEHPSLRSTGIPRVRPSTSRGRSDGFSALRNVNLAAASPMVMTDSNEGTDAVDENEAMLLD